ncbi:unnamed protein product [Bemisia tabaci]|uniref:ZAD domain-containing protein n=1 Tax=Bemisia tabaci TaxID=7038 RepID=A0A9P0AK97_BEMTA|nr:PREDICTED: uncharacterized protein LOC109035484 [Bemisia tabaci]CAH0394615.1 unnamed protein product [Bemisia tabaci]
MGSLDGAVITGFICRLCSKLSRLVIHIYGEQGVTLQLDKKINTYLPISVKFSDPLPKTVCVACVQKLEIHHQLVKRFHAAREHFMESAMNSIRNRSSTSTSCDQSLRCRNSNLNPTSNSSGAEQVTHEYSQADL